MKNCLKFAPSNDSYYGMNLEYLKDCDRVYDLTREIEAGNHCETQHTGPSSKRARPDILGDVSGQSNM